MFEWIACMYVMHHVHTWCLQRPKDNSGFPKTGVTDGCKSSWKLGIDKVSLTNEPPLQQDFLTLWGGI